MYVRNLVITFDKQAGLFLSQVQNDSLNTIHTESKNVKIRVYSNTPEAVKELKNTKAMKFATQDQLAYTSQTLRQVSSKIGGKKLMFNLQNTEWNAIQPKELITKIIADEYLLFEPRMTDFIIVYIDYYVYKDGSALLLLNSGDSNTIIFKRPGDAGKTVHQDLQLTCVFCDSFAYLAQEFINFLEQFSEFVLLVGFGIGIGQQSPLYQLFKHYDEDIYISIKNGGKSHAFKFTQVVTGVRQFPNMLYIDAELLAYQTFSSEDKRAVQTNTLQEYVRVLLKQQVDFPAPPSHDFDVQSLAPYTSYLLYIKYLVDDKQLIIKKVELAAYMYIPLNFALHETLVQCIYLWICRILRSKNVLLTYDSPKSESKTVFQGAFIQSVPQSAEFVPQYFVAEGDFFSLYPTVMVAHFISPESILDSTEEYKGEVHSIDLNIYPSEQYAKDASEVVHFRADRPTIFQEILNPLFTARQTEADPVKKQAIKMILVSIYGLMGCYYSPFYNYSIARAIAAYGRKACVTCRDLIQSGVISCFKSIMCCNTDSVSFTIDIAKSKTIEEEWKVLNAKMCQALGSPIYKFEFETKKFSIATVYPDKKKQCARFLADFTLTRNYFAKGGKKKAISEIIKPLGKSATDFAVKFEFVTSFKYSSVSEKRVYDNIRHAEFIAYQIVAGEYDPLTASAVIVKKQNELISTADAAFQSTNSKIIHEQISIFAEYLKYSPSNTICKYLNQTFNVRQGCLILPYILNSSSKRLCENWIDSDSLASGQYSAKNIDVTKIALKYFDSVKLFFNIDAQVSVPEVAKEDLAERLQQLSTLDSKADFCMRIESSVGKYITYMNIDYESAEILVLSSQGYEKSFHETIHASRVRMFFDIDYHPKEGQTIVLQITHIQQAIQRSIQSIVPINPTLHITKAVGAMQSFHIVLNVTCDLSVNKFVAGVCDMNLKSLLNIEDDTSFFDTGIYSLKKSLRLPFCGKFKHFVYENRAHLPITDSKFSDFFITNTNNSAFDVPFNILLDERECVYLPLSTEMIGSDEEQVFRSYIQQTYQNHAKWTVKISRSGISNGFISASCSESYQCSVCKRTHDSRGLYAFKKGVYLMINCFSNKQYGTVAELPKVQIREEAKHENRIQKYYEHMSAPVYEDTTIICNEKNVQFRIKNDINYIISDMGTGKSQQLKQILNRNDFKTVICLGFRKTFVTEFATKFNLVPYDRILGIMQLSRNPKMIIQVDALGRLEHSCYPQLLIIDEIESVLSKLLSCRQSGIVCQVFLDLIMYSGYVVVMDGLMEPRTIEYLNMLRKTENYSVLLNQYKPRSDYTIDLYPYRRIDADFIVQQFVEACGTPDAPQNVYGMITSNTLGEYVFKHLLSKGIKVVYYHGNNGVLETTNHGEITQQTLKDIEFGDVNAHWTDYQVVIHTSTVTAGISFEKEHFHRQINVFNANTCDPGSFFQGSHRVRNIQSKHIVTFIELDSQHQITSPVNYANIDLSMGYISKAVHVIKSDGLSYLIAWLKAREGCLVKYRLQLLLKYIKQMNYTVVVKDIPADAPKGKVQVDKSVIEDMHAFKLTPYINRELDVPDKVKHAYDQKINLYFMFVNGSKAHEFIDSLSTEQLDLLYRNRFIQKFRSQINCTMLTNLGTVSQKRMEFKELIHLARQNHYTHYTQIDIAKFTYDALTLIDEALSIIQKLAPKHPVNSAAFKNAFKTATAPKDFKDTTSWTSRVKAKLINWDKQVSIQRSLKSPFSLFSHLCAVFTLKLNAEACLYIPDNIFDALYPSVVLKTADDISLDADDSDQSDQDDIHV